jgi:hypothetical protein
MNSRDLELLSAYLDGQLNPSDSARLEARLKSDPELASVLSDIRIARGVLRKLPARKAPRNFTLTRKMVGLKPPLPRTYSIFRFSTAFATLLLFLTFATNFIAPRVSYKVANPAAQSGGGYGGGPGYGMGGGGGGDSFPQVMPDTAGAAATEAPAAEAPSSAAQIAPAPTEMLPSTAASDANREQITPTPEAYSMPKESPTAVAPQGEQTVEQANQAPPYISTFWQVLLTAIAILSGVVAYLIDQSAKSKWKS